MAAGAVAVAGNGAMPHPQVVGVAGASRTAITVEEAESGVEAMLPLGIRAERAGMMSPIPISWMMAHLSFP